MTKDDYYKGAHDHLPLINIDIFHSVGKVADIKEVLMILVNTGKMTDKQSLSTRVGI